MLINDRLRKNDIFTTTKFFLVCLWLSLPIGTNLPYNCESFIRELAVGKMYLRILFYFSNTGLHCLKWAIFELVIWIVCTSKSYHLHEKNVNQASLWRKPSKWLGNGKLVYICFPSNRLHSRRNPDPFGCLTRYFPCFYLILVKTLQ